MAAKILQTPMDSTPEQILFATHAGSVYNPVTNNIIAVSTPSLIEFAMLNWLNGTGIQSSQFDLGAKFAERYDVEGLIEMQVAAANDGSVIEFYISPSGSATAAVGNRGAATGVSGAYSGYSNDLATVVKQLVLVGNFVITDDAVDTQQLAGIGEYYPIHRYGSLIGVNKTGQTICDTDAIEAAIVMNPSVPESQ